MLAMENIIDNFSVHFQKAIKYTVTLEQPAVSSARSHGANWPGHEACPSHPCRTNLEPFTLPFQAPKIWIIYPTTNTGYKLLYLIEFKMILRVIGQAAH